MTDFMRTIVRNRYTILKKHKGRCRSRILSYTSPTTNAHHPERSNKMKYRKRIALFAGQADEAYQSRFISGFLKSSFASDYDVCIFSMYRKYQDTPERERGESNIFNLMNPEKFDGAVILKDSIQTENAAAELESRLKKVSDCPILAVEKESELFPSICTDCYSAEYELISHLIEEHNCRRIVFVGGKKWHKHSKERLRAYRDAMSGHGLTVEERDVMYGDFWYQSGELCAEQILAMKGGLPDAVACANDQMAIGLCKALTEHGVRIPQDIAVVGYDSTFEGQTSPCTLTSASIPAEEFGEYAFRYLQAQMQGREPDSFKLKPHIVLGESCGCSGEDMPEYRIKRDRWGTDISEDGYDSIFNMMDENLVSQNSLADLVNAVYSYVYQLRDISEFHLCIGSDWQHIGSGCHLTNDGYPKQMLHAIKYSSTHKNNMVMTEKLFPSADMLPALDEDRGKPCAYFFTPIFFDNECYGYSVISYGDVPRSYDGTYRRWTGTVCRGFEFLRRNIIKQLMQEHLERIQNNKFSVSEHSYELLGENEKEKYRIVGQILDENLLDYHFQPIVSARDGSVYAYEALMRSRTEKRVSPLDIIKYAAMQGRLSDVERSTFLNVLDIVNRDPDAFGDAKVFINSIPGVSISDEATEAIDRYLMTYANKIVVELTEEAELSDDDLGRLKEYFSRLNINIAVDDYGTGYSNVSNLLRYMPNCVKIDRSLLSGIQNQQQKQHFVREIIDFCHDNNILALAEGVETTEELQTVIHLGADLIQGYYTARPSAEVVLQISDQRRAEIRRYYQERVDGQNKNIYIAGKTSRVSLIKLIRDGCTDIIVGQEEMVYKDITFVGAPQMTTGMHLRIEAGHSGRITLEDAFFSNIKNRPCIELGENTDVTLVLCGQNTLRGAGIQVPESSRLVIEGDGELNIDLNAVESYGIGNAHDARHGELVFEEDGPLNITSRGKKCICIGSGLGGVMHINRGEFNLKSSNDTCVGIGALSGDVSLSLMTCHIEADFTITTGLVLGSLEGNADISVEQSAVNYFASGTHLAGLGSLYGSSSVNVTQAGIFVDLRADHCTCLGSLQKSSEIKCDSASLHLNGGGKEALAFGGIEGDTSVLINSSDLHIKLNNSLGVDTYAPAESFTIIDGRERIVVNGEDKDHPQSSNYGNSEQGE